MSDIYFSSDQEKYIVYNQWIRIFFIKWYLANSIFIALYYYTLTFCMDRNSKTFKG